MIKRLRFLLASLLIASISAGPEAFIPRGYGSDVAEAIGLCRAVETDAMTPSMMCDRRPAHRARVTVVQLGHYAAMGRGNPVSEMYDDLIRSRSLLLSSLPDAEPQFRRGLQSKILEIENELAELVTDGIGLVETMMHFGPLLYVVAGRIVMLDAHHQSNGAIHRHVFRNLEGELRRTFHRWEDGHREVLFFKESPAAMHYVGTWKSIDEEGAFESVTADFIYFLSVLKKAVPIVAAMVRRHARFAASAIALGEPEQVISQHVTDTVELLAEIMAQAHAERNRRPGYAAMGRNGRSIPANGTEMATRIFKRWRPRLNAAVLSGLLDWVDDDDADYLMAARVPRTNRLSRSTRSARVNVILQSMA